MIRTIMKLGAAALVLCGLAACSTPGETSSHASARIDCPLRDAPYSADSPIMDILLKPEAVAVLEQAAPGATRNLPPRFMSTEAPSFSAILSLHQLAGFGAFRQDQIPAIDAALRALPVTDADRQARCARYDNDRPRFDLPSDRPRILLFEKMTGFRDGPSVEAAHAAFVAMAERNGWAIATTTSGGAINATTLRQFDAIIWNNVSGDVLTLTQRRALQNYMEKGGGFVAVHGSAGDPVYFWDWYADTLIGARFIGHPMEPQFQEAQVVVTGQPSAIGRNLAPGWRMTDEWYSFQHSARDSGSTIVATLDESTYSPVGRGGQNLRMGADHSLAWTRCINRGRMFYSAIGHRPETYSDAHYVDMLTQAITWAAGNGGTQCVNGAEVAR